MSTPSAPAEPWRALFQEGGRQCATVTVIRKHGQPLLVLAGPARFRAKALELYPAQSLPARCARWLLRWSPWLPFWGRETLNFSPEGGPLEKILFNGNGSSPAFAILCGNPNTPGQRFMILTRREGQSVVIKAGISETARELVRGEARFLKKIQGRSCAPCLLEEIHTGRLEAFLTPWVEGPPPSAHALEAAANLLGTWVLPEPAQPLGEIPAWKRLIAANPPGAARWLALQERPVAATLTHGDFAPWNLKATPQGWVVLDWERGEPRGVPAWDWFHFLIQPLALVARAPAGRIAQAVEAELATPRFRAYAQKTGIKGLERELLAAYLEYNLYVIRPAEGSETLAALSQSLQPSLPPLSR